MISPLSIIHLIADLFRFGRMSPRRFAEYATDQPSPNRTVTYTVPHE